MFKKIKFFLLLIWQINFSIIKIEGKELGHCWQTGCQLNNWAVKGCEQYDRIPQGAKNCQDGQGKVYNCCEKSPNSSSNPAEEYTGCWKTGCQLNDWAIKGCEQYDRIPQGAVDCQNGEGKIYNCCIGEKKQEVDQTIPLNFTIYFEEFESALHINNYYQLNSTMMLEKYENFIEAVNSTKAIKSKIEGAMALAQFFHESLGLSALEELACLKSQCSDEYRTKNCDVPGVFYYGRGYIQLTWCYNYREASKDLFGDERLVQNPDMVSKNESIAWYTALWFWKKKVHKSLKNSMKFGVTTRAINGQLECLSKNGHSIAKKRFEIYKNILEAFGIEANVADEKGCYN